jgi:hypothetical protein
LALDDDQWDALVRHLHSVSAPELPPDDTRLTRQPHAKRQW